MRNAKLLAGTMTVAIILSPSSFRAYSIEQEGEKLTTKPIVVEHKLDRVAELNSKAEELLVLSESTIEDYNELYESLYTKSLRLELKHITFSNRLALNESVLIRNSSGKGGAAVSAYSMNLLTPSAVTAYELNQFLDGTGMAGLGTAFVQAELDTGVNAVFLTALGILESSWGDSNIARDKNNLFGYGAYDSSPYQSAVHFGSMTEGVVFVANRIKNNYLLPSGKYYSGSTLPGVNKKYSSASDWSQKVASTMESINRSVMSKQDLQYKEQESTR